MAKKTMIYYRGDRHTLFYENDLFRLDMVVCFSSQHTGSSHSKWSQPYMHNHFYYELHTVLSGSCEFQTEQRKHIVVNEGEFILFPPKYKHQITGEHPPFSKLGISFTMTPKKTVEPNFYRTAAKLCRNVSAHPCSKAMLFLAKNILENEEEKSHEYINIIFFSMLSYVIEAFRLIVGDAAAPVSADEADTRINLALDYIKSNISSAISVSSLSKTLHISPKQLTRDFKAALGTTPGSYIKDYKITCICDLLVTTDLSVEDIAEFMAYPDTSSMIKAFKRLKGVTPLQYRQSAKKPL